MLTRLVTGNSITSISKVLVALISISSVLLLGRSRIGVAWDKPIRIVPASPPRNDIVYKTRYLVYDLIAAKTITSTIWPIMLDKLPAIIRYPISFL